MRGSKGVICTIMVLVIVMLTGCSDNRQSSPNQEEARIFKHPLGEVRLTEPPKRIVALDFSYTEDLLALGITPVGVADIDSPTGFNTLVNIQPVLGSEVVDVGGRQEPNLEIIAELQPDLILTNVYFVQKNYEKLNAIAPTMVFDPYPPEGKEQYEEMTETFRVIADMVGKGDEAEQQLKDLQQAYDEAKVRLEAANKAGAKVVFAQMTPGQSGPSVWLFTGNSQGARIMKEIGLHHVYQPEVFEQRGVTVATVEALMDYQDASLIYLNMDNTGGLQEQLKSNALWSELDFVKQQRVYGIDRRIWGYGGPISAKVLVGEVVKALTAQ